MRVGPFADLKEGILKRYFEQVYLHSFVTI